MPDLGDYAVEVLSAYAVSLVLLAVIAVQSLRRWRRLRAELQRMEGARDGKA